MAASVKNKQRKSKPSNVLLRRWKEEFRQIENIFSDALETHRYIEDFVNFFEHKQLNQPELLYAQHYLLTQYHFIVLQLGKLIDSDNRALSLKLLLSDISKHSHDFPISILDHEKKPWAYEEEFILRYVLPCGINPKSVDQDIETLNKTLEKIKQFRNKHVAHAQKKKINIAISRKELGVIIASVEAQLKTYNLLLNQAGIESYLPLQILGWESILDSKKRGSNL